MGSKRIQFSSFPFITKVVGKKESTLLGHVYAITTTKSLIYPFPATQFNKKIEFPHANLNFRAKNWMCKWNEQMFSFLAGKFVFVSIFRIFRIIIFRILNFRAKKVRFFLFFKFPHLNLNFRAKIIRKKFWMKRQKFLFLVLAQKFKLFSKL